MFFFPVLFCRLNKRSGSQYLKHSPPKGVLRLPPATPVPALPSGIGTVTGCAWKCLSRLSLRCTPRVGLDSLLESHGEGWSSGSQPRRSQPTRPPPPDLTPKRVSAGTKRSASGCNSLRGKVLPSSVHLAGLNQGIPFCEAAFFFGGGSVSSVGTG